MFGNGISEAYYYILEKKFKKLKNTFEKEFFKSQCKWQFHSERIFRKQENTFQKKLELFFYILKRIFRKDVSKNVVLCLRKNF